MVDMASYQHLFEPAPTDFVQWEDAPLRQHVRQLLMEQGVANRRKADELEHSIGMALGELALRNLERQRAEDAAAIGHAALAGPAPAPNTLPERLQAV